MIPAAAWLLVGGMVLEYSFGGTAWSAEVSRAHYRLGPVDKAHGTVALQQQVVGDSPDGWQ